MAGVIEEGYIWIAPSWSKGKYQILIAGTDERTRTISASFSKAVAPEVGTFKILVDNNNRYFTNKYSGGETTEFRYDFGDGTTRRFLGTVEEPKKVFGDSGSQIEIVGSHVTGELLNRTATASYDGTVSANAVIIDLISRFAPPGFTTNNVKSCSVFPVRTFIGVPLWKAISEIVALTRNFDLYVDDDKDVHFFQQGSVLNEDEAVIFGQDLLELESLGTDTLDVRNKIRVYGKSDGFPVIYTAQDTTSQGTYGVREQVIIDDNIKTEEEAEHVAEAALAVSKNTFAEGGGTSLILPSLNPGDYVFISSPPHDVLGRYRFKKFTHKVPEEMTEFEVEDVRA